MLNLFNYLTEEDNKKIEDYIHAYGAKDYIGNEKYLAAWAESNKKLFHLLGGNLIVKVPVSVEKDSDVFREELSDLVSENDFCDIYSDELWEKLKNTDMDWNDKHKIDHISATVLSKDSFPYAIKYKLPDAKNTLQLQVGMKPIRAYQKIMEYFGLSDKCEELFEDFRIKHSMIFNDKFLKGNLCFSIHPLDYLTMSDNASNWSSCMSWKEDGCYHLGTVEMMNSNNVICVYLEGKEDFTFGEKQGYQNTWNNKRWRQLFYCTKDIIVSGKSYPYYSERLTKAALEKLREFALTNWNNSYEYGIERYQDMIHVGNHYRMEQNKIWIEHKMTKKHNIIFDCNAMYNDMLNDRDYEYWCIRNKVKKNIVINYSGKAPCICCGENALKKNKNLYEYEEDSYNARYNFNGDVMCTSCREDHYCDNCSKTKSIKSKHFTTVEGSKIRLCNECASKLFYCPACGHQFFYEGKKYRYRTLLSQIKEFSDDESNEDIAKELDLFNNKDIINSEHFIEYICCERCSNTKSDSYIAARNNLVPEFECIQSKWSCNTIDNFWRIYVSNKIIPKEEALKFGSKNLVPVPIDKISKSVLWT